MPLRFIRCIASALMLWCLGCSGSPGTAVSKDPDAEVESPDLSPDQRLPDVVQFEDQSVDQSGDGMWDFSQGDQISEFPGYPDKMSDGDSDDPDQVFGRPCQSNDDCDGAPCLWDRGEKRCSMFCVEECPTGYQCEAYLPPPDLTFACVSLFPSLCLPCLASKDCPSSQDRCIVYESGAGSFCGGGCDAQRPCPDGFVCMESKSVEGDTVQQCLFKNAPLCPCSPWAVANNLITSCKVANESGACSGTRSCTADGWSDCSAQNPQQELCFNQLDDDCDGQVDNPSICNACQCGNGICEFQCNEAYDWTSGLDSKLNCAVDCASCGNGHCDPGESFSACPQDCCGACGDGLCRAGVCGETTAACPLDCASDLCGNGTCSPPENSVDCPADCPKGQCGNLTCEPGESPAACPSDCAASCGDCICQLAENAGNCPVDCGFCGDGFCLGNCPSMYPAENLATCFQDCCLPDCSGKVCGSDGCGGQCGTCNPGFVCSNQGACICVPQCQGKECGPDGCGGSCGTCPASTKCDQGLCMTGCDSDANCPEKFECANDFCTLDLVDDLRLLAPTQVTTVPGAQTPNLSAAVLEAGITESNGAPAGLTVQFGTSSLGWDPQLHPDSWTWSSAAYQAQDQTFDVFGSVAALPEPGDYFFTFRATLDGSGFRYADTDGLANGFDPALVGRWTVTPPPVIVSVSPKTATVLGGDQLLVSGTGFHQGLVLKVDNVSVTPASVTPTQVLFVTPSHASGPVAVRVENPDGQHSVLNDAFHYVQRFTPTLDGNLAEWSGLLRLGSNTLVSNWDATKNKLSHIYAAFDSSFLYIAIDGYSESMNYVLCYVDMDFGANSGVKQMAWLSDNTGNGDLDDAFSNVLEVSVAGFGADWGFGTRGMASFTQGSDLGLSTFVGWRAMGTPYNLPWFQGSVRCTGNAIEAAIPLSTVLPSGIPAGGTEVALFAKITDRYGDIGGICNQTLPEYFDPGNVKKIDAVVRMLLRN